MIALNNINTLYKYNRPTINSSNIRFGSLNNIKKDEFVSCNEDIEAYNYFMKADAYDLKREYMVNETVYPLPYQKVLKSKIPTLNNPHFTQEDYGKLSSKEKKILRKVINKKTNMDWNVNSRTIKKDTNKILNIAQNIKDNMDKKYPNGYKLISIGNSTAPFTETMKILGADTHTIPFSIDGLTLKEGFPYRKFNQPEPYKKEDWKNYLEHHGIDKDFEERTGKKLIFTDYVFSGKTMGTMENILENLDFPPNTELVDFIDLPNNLNKKERINLNNSLRDEKFKYLSEKMTGKMCIIENTDFVKHPEYIENQGERFASKLFKFALFETLEERKMPLIERMLKKIF